MKQETKELDAMVLQYIFNSEETHYEETGYKVFIGGCTGHGKQHCAECDH